ncbi:hypothetical protein CU669_16875 [Paramagnetospirillum kuznetsovii]|uniref:Uncharacterized protein n=1 Tax=Paramagnetospirillum kuznetsovii TaxID=2053833 RepID=A0A364NV25_9PROT|nr:hypothetical protein CU669_16875 [Paramagnetospirillum kuznetsovii]
MVGFRRGQKVKTIVTAYELIDIVKTFGVSLTRATVANWCDAFDIGKKSGHVWLIDVDKMQALLDSDLSDVSWGKLHAVQNAMKAIRANGGTASLV